MKILFIIPALIYAGLTRFSYWLDGPMGWISDELFGEPDHPSVSAETLRNVILRDEMREDFNHRYVDSERITVYMEPVDHRGQK